MKQEQKKILGGEEYKGTLMKWEELDEKTKLVQQEGGWMEYLGSDEDPDGEVFHVFSEMFIQDGIELEGRMYMVSRQKKLARTAQTTLDDGKIWALAHGRRPWTLEMIADEMGCSVMTIYKHLKRMREERGEY